MKKFVTISFFAIAGLAFVPAAQAGCGKAECAKQAACKHEGMDKPEFHEKMAEHHKKMGECLKSGKTGDECHEAMAADMQDMKMGDHEGCPFSKETKGAKAKKTEHKH